MRKLKQIVPQDICLKCDVCCRFPEANSPWRPVFTKEEVRWIDNKLLVDGENKIKLIPYKYIYTCPCYSDQDNRCKVYNLRPFDCQLYPFLLVREDNKIFLGIDKKCPYAKVILSEKKKKYFIDYLKNELTSPDMVCWLKEHPSLLCVYNDDALEFTHLFNL